MSPQEKAQLFLTSSSEPGRGPNASPLKGGCFQQQHVGAGTQQDKKPVIIGNNLMKTKQLFSSPGRVIARRAGTISMLLLCCLCQTWASTLVSGNVSGTWTKAGSPYVAIDNCTVPSGQVLTIQPGVIVIIGQGLEITVLGVINASGTAAEPIAIKGPTAANRWNRIHVEHGGGAQSQFRHCQFSDAQVAVSIRIYAQNAAMTTLFQNCTFSNYVQSAIYGESYGHGYTPNYETIIRLEPRLNPTIANCRFVGGDVPCRFYARGTAFSDWWHTTTLYAYGAANPILRNCIFEGAQGKAVSFEPGPVAGSSTGQVLNVFIHQSSRAIETSDPFDIRVRNSLFTSCGIAMRRTGSLSSQIAYNCFYGNATNFAGYPGAYGQIVMANHNGTPCDVAYNIYQNPMLLDSTDYYLSPGSPCVDAGDNSASFNDCFLGSPFSLGGLINDIGPYGGPSACGWISSPNIFAQPRSQSSCLGQSALFSIGAAGSQLAYQWWFNGQPLAGKTSTNMALNNLQKANAGQYWCVVTNTSGSVTSAPAQLVVYDACIDIHMYAGLTVAGQVGSQYVLSYTTDLGNPNSWVPLATNTMSASGWFYLDMESPFSPRRFYRADLRP